MAVPMTARRRVLPRMSGLAWRRARWGYVFIAPWLIGFLLFTAMPMVATFVFTLTNVNLSQAEPLRFVGLDNWAKLLADKTAWDSWRSPSSTRCWPCRSPSPCRSSWR